MVRSNEDMGKDYIIEFTPPTTEEIRSARPLAMVLPHDALTHAMLITATLCADTEDDRAVSLGRHSIVSEQFGHGWTLPRRTKFRG